VEQNTRTLTKAVASGDPEAFSRFYETYFDALYRMARHATKRDEQFCLDVVQDAMMKLIRSIPVLDNEPALRAWLRRTVYSCAIDRIRQEARRQRTDHHAAESRRDAASEVARTESVSEQLAWLENQLAQLDGSSRSMLIMRHRFGWTLARIGREFGLSPGAVDGRLSRLIDTLRRRAKGAEHGE
jgi:RNA polymerase sigma factor (sigma-70 family)